MHHDFSQVGRLITAASTPKGKEGIKKKSYEDILGSVVNRLLQRDASKERDE